MDFSKLKLDVYDFLGIILPGLIAVAEGWILLRGWAAFVASMNHMGGTALTLLFLFAFGVGHIVQELGEGAIQLLKGKRYLRKSRDAFWASDESKLLRHAVKNEFGHDIPSVDVAFDYCLIKLKGQFEKRDIFIATSDLSRSLVVLALIGIAPAWRISFHDLGLSRTAFEFFALELVVLAMVALLAWRRMIRFRELSEVTVFRAYLGVATRREVQSPETHEPG